MTRDPRRECPVRTNHLVNSFSCKAGSKLTASPLFAYLLSIFVLQSTARSDVDFEADIAPIFQEHCLRCHYPGNEKGEFSIATVDSLRENEYVSAGDAESSYLIDLVSSHDGEPAEMPLEGEPLSAGQVAMLKEWIDSGAQWPDDFVVKHKPEAGADWWAFKPLPKDEASTDPAAIDHLIDAKLQDRGLKRNPQANRRELMIRATYDLTGLPPTPAEVAAFVASDSPTAYEDLIDRLLASPRYGEHWGRHWLDVVRFGESNGFERNVLINELWPFRDYVIDSLNDDKPFDLLIREHLAGDVIGSEDPGVAIGSAFLVAGPYDNVGNSDPVQAAQIRANTIDEMIRASSQAFLGLTVGCARCHDHKFDPISQADYYSLYATFSGVEHGAVELSTETQRKERSKKLQPLHMKRNELSKAIDDTKQTILNRAKEKLDDYAKDWVRPAINRTGTEDVFEPIEAKFVRLVCEAQDGDVNSDRGFRIDEFEVWSVVSPGSPARNVAAASAGGKASGASRKIEDFPDAYGPQLAIDGKAGAKFISADSTLTIELSEPTTIDRVHFSSARGAATPGHHIFTFVAEYRIEVSPDGKDWSVVASSHDRLPNPGDQYTNHRLMKLETNEADQQQLLELSQQLNKVNQQIAQVPKPRRVFIGKRNAEKAKGPFHLFLGGSPQRLGDPVVPESLSVLSTLEDSGETKLAYQLNEDSAEAERRLAFANWITNENNPLTPRVLANRVWHYHFGTGIVDTPSDFGFMGGRPTHPELLDHLAGLLIQSDWKIKDLHRIIMLSETYRQSSAFDKPSAAIDADARLLWRFPPRRLSAEEIRDSILMVSGVLKLEQGGPGFRLYKYMQDNVSTYAPLDQHPVSTFRRGVYHQNARASVVDLMTDFDQPDCTFATPKRSSTTTPLQALTMLNHSFTLDMAKALAEKVESYQLAGGSYEKSDFRPETWGADSDVSIEQVVKLYEICYLRTPSDQEVQSCSEFLEAHGLEALCRIMLNTSELLYVY